ncbi:MAG TPA: hypothetical protein PKD24_05045 [Pyrinomonadaceae bacterium]|nr:hypothetical protein [Pyrinomonadaceae bacterium]HMP64919.1 hypothetical protein [Pyrinomonadaceae bacterium]
MKSPRSQYHFNFESYGVVLRIESNSPETLAIAKNVAAKALIGQMTMLSDAVQAPYSFSINYEDGRYEICRDGESLSSGSDETVFLKYFDSMVRSRVTEKAKDLVFVHAGAVGWKGNAILIPARSGMGKTTLVSELIQLGADYYSDEYAVLDIEGMNHPFARPLSMRVTDAGEMRQIDVEPADLQATVGTVRLPVGLVVLTEYKPEIPLTIGRLSIGSGILETVNHTIPFAVSPENSLKVLKTALSRAIILKGMRGDAKQFARSVISFFDYQLDSGMADRTVESFFGGDNE